MPNAIALEAGGRILLEDGTSLLLNEQQPPDLLGVNSSPYTTYAVEVAWGQTWAKTGLFTFGVSQFGGSDVMPSATFGGVFNSPNGDLTRMTRQIEIVRGRGDLLSTMMSGTCTLDLSDPNGLLNIRNPSSPLAGTLYTGVPMRVSGYTSGGTKVPLYYGFISTLTSDPGGRYGTAQIVATDLFTRLAQEKPNLGSLLGQTTGSAINALLVAIGWDDHALLDIGVGDTLPSPYTRADGTNDVLALIEELLVSERGYFFIAGDGTATYLSRYQVIQSASQATLDRTMTAAPSTLDASRVVNRWTVARTDMAGNPIGTPQVAAASTLDRSYLRYHYMDDAIVSPIVRTDVAGLALAQYLLALTKDPSGVGWTVPINPSNHGVLDQMLIRDLGDRVTLTVDPLSWAAYTQDYTIQQITHTITTDPTQPRHTTVWGLADFPITNPFTFGVSTFGGADVFTY